MIGTPKRIAGSLLALYAALAGTVSPAAAQQGATLSWIGGPGTESCIDRPHLIAAVERRLGRSVFRESPQVLAVEVTVTRPRPDRWQARITALGASSGTREISHWGPTCGPLDGAIVLVVSTIIDPNSASLQGQAGEASAPGGAQTTTQTATTAPQSTNASARGGTSRGASRYTASRSTAETPGTQSTPRTWRIGIAVGAAGNAGWLPEPGPAGLVRLAIETERGGRIELEARYEAAQDLSLAGGRARFGYAGSALRACAFAVQGSAGGLGGCVGGGLGAFAVSTTDYAANDALSRVGASLDARLRASLALASAWSLLADIAAVLPLVRDEFYISDPVGERRTVHQVAPLVGEAAVIAEVRF